MTSKQDLMRHEYEALRSTEILTSIKGFFESHRNGKFDNESKKIASEIDDLVLLIIKNGQVEDLKDSYLSCNQMSTNRFVSLEIQTNEDSIDSNRHQEAKDSNGNLSFKNPLVENNYTVTSLSWHHDQDIFAVGYSRNHDRLVSQKGVILIWDVNTPTHPKKVILIDSEVSAIDFSKGQPSIVAVGLRNGCISLYDITLPDPFLVDSFSTYGRHMSSVTQIRWIFENQNESIEKLVSLGTDGKVIKWSIQKEFIPHPMITLKRHRSHSKEQGYLQSVIGLCMDFPGFGESPIYICGAEEGSIFRCSWSSNDQYINHICAHNGPVTQVIVSPFDENVFISSGADSTVKIWFASIKQNSIREMMTISPLKLLAPINNIAWSPTVSTIFCLVTADSRLEVWDLAHSITEPIYYISSKSQIMMRNEMTVLSFSKNGRAVFVGNDLGVVQLYELPSSCYEAHQSVNLINSITSWK